LPLRVKINGGVGEVSESETKLKVEVAIGFQ